MIVLENWFYRVRVESGPIPLVIIEVKTRDSNTGDPRWSPWEADKNLDRPVFFMHLVCELSRKIALESKKKMPKPGPDVGVWYKELANEPS